MNLSLDYPLRRSVLIPDVVSLLVLLFQLKHPFVK